MTREEMISHLGTIAKSGTLDFMEKASDRSTDMIGQFGVGFYSAFVVADKVEVISKTADASQGTQAYRWVSEGGGEYEVEPCDDQLRGTKIILHLKDDATSFSKLATVKSVATKYSSFVNFPIKMIEGETESEINKQEAIWLKGDVTPEEHTQFYQFINNTSYGDPFYTLTYKTDAPLSIQAVFYVPEEAPNRWFSKDPEVGVALHSRRVMVKKHADKIIPRWLHWVKGVVDCEDMPMNISRENMQDTRLMEKLSAAVVRRLLRFFDDSSRKDPEKYAKFFKNYSYYIKAGLLEDAQSTNGRHKDQIVKLLRFECSEQEKGKLISLQEYVDSCNDEQKNIYYHTSSSRDVAMNSPFMETFTKRKRPVLIFTDEIDEFVANGIGDFKGKKLVSLDSNDTDFEMDLDKDPSEAEDAEGSDARQLTDDEQTAVESFLKQELGDKVTGVKFTTRLTDSPAIVTSQLSPHLRKMMKSMMQGADQNQAMPVTLEVNPKHHLITTLASVRESNLAVARVCAQQLYDTAMIAGGMVEEPKVLLSRLNKILEVCLYQGAGFDYRTGQYTAAPAPESSEPAATPEPEVKTEGNKFEEVAQDKKFEEVKDEKK
jgi:TNF receptor-associated protein 1